MRNRKLVHAMSISLTLLFAAEANAGLFSRLCCHKRRRCVTQELSLDRGLDALLSGIQFGENHQSQPPKPIKEDDDRPRHVYKFLNIDCWKGLGRLGHFHVPHNIGRWQYPLSDGERKAIEFAITYHGHGSYLRKWDEYIAD